MGLLLNSALLFIAMLTILLGTIYPLILDALHLGTISVGAPYFNMVMMPLVFIIMVFMGFGPLCRWQQQAAKNIYGNMLLAKKFCISYYQLPLLCCGVLPVSLKLLPSSV